MRKYIFFFATIFSFCVAEAQQPLPASWLRPMAPLDSLTVGAERRNALAGLRRPSKTEQKNIVVLSSSAKGTKDQDAQYFGQLERKQVYKVNSAAIVSKNAGETEKNLQRLFNEAAAKQSILFFDDAGQLFSKSSQPESTAKYLESLAQSKRVPIILWCEDDCLQWLKGSPNVAIQR